MNEYIPARGELSATDPGLSSVKSQAPEKETVLRGEGV